ncbi:hypothetical protein KC19_7G037100 [Ceratodon purpureus]|uniref:Uncharacterized protein n=1 Tax=Ceratodon purpureus TaxID=3225 RepID=A0A8T0H6S4_CERPU|nr:hypothetical protein KC19_7G037100 [Ceratodon purpureus]
MSRVYYSSPGLFTYCVNSAPNGGGRNFAVGNSSGRPHGGGLLEAGPLTDLVKDLELHDGGVASLVDREGLLLVVLRAVRLPTLLWLPLVLWRRVTRSLQRRTSQVSVGEWSGVAATFGARGVLLERSVGVGRRKRGVEEVHCRDGVCLWFSCGRCTVGSAELDTAAEGFVLE